MVVFVYFFCPHRGRGREFDSSRYGSFLAKRQRGLCLSSSHGDMASAPIEVFGRFRGRSLKNRNEMVGID